MWLLLQASKEPGPTKSLHLLSICEAGYFHCNKKIHSKYYQILKIPLWENLYSPEVIKIISALVIYELSGSMLFGKQEKIFKESADSFIESQCQCICFSVPFHVIF